MGSFWQERMQQRKLSVPGTIRLLIFYLTMAISGNVFSLFLI
jgi:hypothetical protein